MTRNCLSPIRTNVSLGCGLRPLIKTRWSFDWSVLTLRSRESARAWALGISPIKDPPAFPDHVKVSFSERFLFAAATKHCLTSEEIKSYKAQARLPNPSAQVYQAVFMSAGRKTSLASQRLQRPSLNVLHSDLAAKNRPN